MRKQPDNRSLFLNPLCRLLLAFALCTWSSIALTQELRDAALDKGVMFGSPLFELFDESNKQLFRDNVSVGTAPTYWKYTTRPTQAYSFAETDVAIRFAEGNGWDQCKKYSPSVTLKPPHEYACNHDITLHEIMHLHEAKQIGKEQLLYCLSITDIKNY